MMWRTPRGLSRMSTWSYLKSLRRRVHTNLRMGKTKMTMCRPFSCQMYSHSTKIAFLEELERHKKMRGRRLLMSHIESTQRGIGCRPPSRHLTPLARQFLLIPIRSPRLKRRPRSSSCKKKKAAMYRRAKRPISLTFRQTRPMRMTMKMSIARGVWRRSSSSTHSRAPY
jgi:hypothetical protein